MGHLFAYGTLMCEEILFQITGRHLSHVPGVLRGFRRRAVIGEPYPAIVPEPQGTVHGVVCGDVPDSAWDLLDRFEGGMYARQPVRVEMEDGTPVDAETYVMQPAFMDRLGSSDWDFGEFIRNGKAAFQKRHWCF